MKHSFTLYLNLSPCDFHLKSVVIAGSDGAFIGPTQNQYAILDDDGVGLVLYSMEEETNLATLTDPVPEPADSRGPDGALDENDFSETSTKRPLDKKGSHVPIQFAFDTPVQRIFSCPLGELSYCLVEYEVFLWKIVILSCCIHRSLELCCLLFYGGTRGGVLLLNFHTPLASSCSLYPSHSVYRIVVVILGVCFYPATFILYVVMS